MPFEEYKMSVTNWLRCTRASDMLRKEAASVKAMVLKPRWSMTRLLSDEKPKHGQEWNGWQTPLGTVPLKVKLLLSAEARNDDSSGGWANSLQHVR